MQFRSLAAVVIAVFAAAPLWVCASQFDPQVARHFGIPEGTVKSRVRSGLRRIRFDLIDLNDAA